jgi:hypothetical protein
MKYHELACPSCARETCEDCVILEDVESIFIRERLDVEVLPPTPEELRLLEGKGDD